MKQEFYPRKRDKEKKDWPFEDCQMKIYKKQKCPIEMARKGAEIGKQMGGTKGAIAGGIVGAILGLIFC